MKSILFFFTLFILLGGELFSSYKLELIKTIGDDRDNYMFYQISGAVLSDQKDIFVSDSKGHFVAKYNWNGQFIKRIGQLGQGNGDFDLPKSLSIINSKLYIFDASNYRIAWTDLNLSQLKYQRIGNKEKKPWVSFASFIVLKHGQCIGNSFIPWDDNGRMVNFDWEKNKGQCFFNRFPANCNKYSRNKELSREFMDLSYYSMPVYGYDAVKGNLLITYQFPDNPIKFYLYTKEGKELKVTEYPLEKQYKFPEHYYKQPKSRPYEFYNVAIDTILMYGRKFLAFTVKLHYKGKMSEKVEQFCLMFDENGKFLEKFPVEKGLRVFFISKDGYVLAKNYEADEEQLFIYKITWSK